MKRIFEYFEDRFLYPEPDLLLRGIHSGVLFDPVSVTYLNGFINYVDIVAAVLLHEYTNTAEEFAEQVADIEKQAAEQRPPHTDCRKYDNMLILGKTNDKYVVFLSDNDVSDCAVGGLALETFNTVSEAIDALYKQADQFVADGSALNYSKIPKSFFRGWITL